jgi:hypothetical protein
MWSSQASALRPSALIVLLATAPAFADSMTLFNPLGNAAFNHGAGNPAPAALDILQVTFSTDGGLVSFTAQMAGDLNTIPNPRGPQGAYFWAFAMNTNPTTNMGGLPSPEREGSTWPAEFFTWAYFDGNAFSAVFVDRRPALTGGEEIIVPVEAQIDGPSLTIALPPDLSAEVLADAAPFQTLAPAGCAMWWMNTGYWNTGADLHESIAFHVADTTGRHDWPGSSCNP